MGEEERGEVGANNEIVEEVTDRAMGATPGEDTKDSLVAETPIINEQEPLIEDMPRPETKMEESGMAADVQQDACESEYNVLYNLQGRHSVQDACNEEAIVKA